jgi:DNA-binding transcriptional regulator YiaG
MPNDMQTGPERFLGELIDYRAQLGLTQREASGRLGVSMRTLQNWEINRASPREPLRTMLISLMRQERRRGGSVPAATTGHVTA